MGRLSTFEDRDVFAAVGAEVAATGQLTVQALTEATRLSIGSIYHRFGSREALLAETWLNAARHSQALFLDALRSGEPDAGERAALAIPKFCRASPGEAVVLACCSRQQFLGAKTPAALAAEIASVNDELEKEIRAFARKVDRSLTACRLGLIAYPLAAVRLFLPDKPVPPSIDEEVRKVCRAALSISATPPSRKDRR